MITDSENVLQELSEISLPATLPTASDLPWWKAVPVEQKWRVQTFGRSWKRVQVFGNVKQRRSDPRHAHYQLILRQARRKWCLAARANPVQVFPFGGQHQDAAHRGQLAAS